MESDNKKSLKILGIIPSRLKSTRIPNKPLIKINNETLITRVHRLASQASILDKVIVATDALEIKNIVEKDGGIAELTSTKHVNGTERMTEIIQDPRYNDYDIYVLICGDEALLKPNHINIAVNTLVESDCDGSILALKFYRRNSPSDFKLVLNKKNEVMYISRGDIPSEFRNKSPYFLKAYHLMAFSKKTLIDYSSLAKTPLESIEDHEHLRLLENGYKLKCAIVDSDSISVDIEADIDYVLEKIKTEEKTNFKK